MTFPIYNYSPFGDSWLLSDIGPTDTTLSVVSGAGNNFSASNFVVYCQAECIVVSSRNGDVFSGLTRAANFTAGASHIAGERVAERISALHFSVVQNQYPVSVPPGNQTIYGTTYISGDYTIPSGSQTEIVSGAVLEIG